MSHKMKVQTNIRWMIRRDLASVLRIEAEQFSDPWSEEDFIDRLKNRIVIALVADVAGCVKGFILYELHATSLHVINLAVAPEAERQGIGRAIIEKLIWKLSNQRRTYIECIESERNLEAQHFFRAMGFRAVRVIRNYDSDGDAYVFRYSL